MSEGKAKSVCETGIRTDEAGDHQSKREAEDVQHFRTFTNNTSCISVPFYQRPFCLGI